MLELSSAELDSRSILTTVLAGDLRLADRLEEAQLLPIASRIRARLRTEALAPVQLLQCVNHLLKMAGNPKLGSVALFPHHRHGDCNAADYQTILLSGARAE